MRMFIGGLLAGLAAGTVLVAAFLWTLFMVI